VSTLSFKATDPEGDDIQYEIQWDTDPLLSSPSSKTTSYYGSGVEATTTIDLDAVDPEQVYYWNARAMTTTADWQYRKKITIDHTKVGVGVSEAPWYNTDWQYRNEITIDHTKVGVGVSEAPWYDTDWQYRNKITIDHTNVSGEPWYNTDWKYCKKITVTAGSTAVPSGYTASVTFDHAALFSAGKSLVSGDDIRILHWNGSIWTELDRVLDPLSAFIAKFLADRHACNEAAYGHRDFSVRAGRRDDPRLHFQEQRAGLYVCRPPFLARCDRHPQPGNRNDHYHQCFLL